MRGEMRRRRLGMAVAVVALMAAACSVKLPGGPDAGFYDDPSSTTSSTIPVLSRGDETIPLSEFQITVNVDLTDTGFEPATVYIPQGRGVQLILRNRGNTEHHYRVQGLIPGQITWLASAEYNLLQLQDEVPPEEMSEAEHLLHHLIAFVPFRDPSPFGVTVLSNEVHGYAEPRSRDIIRFIPTNAGTFEVQDVLHPEITGRLVVFTP
jgi:hypothetical protein